MKRALSYITFAFMVFLFSCRKDIGKSNFGGFPNDIGSIIETKCAVAGCHNSKSYEAAGSFNLDSWQSMFYGSSNGAPVIPFNSKFSSLCYFINPYSDLGLQNTPLMPLNRDPLSRNEVKKIEDWIDKGAPDLNGNIWASNPLQKKLYACNQGCDVVTVFDSETKLPIRYVKVGNKPTNNTPHQIRVSPDGQYWYVVFIYSNIMQKFRCSDDSYVGDIPLTPAAAGKGTADAQDWNTFVITKDSKRAYCISWTQNGSLSVVDLENMRWLKYIGGLSYPHGVTLNVAEDKVYIAAQTGNYITEFDTGLVAYLKYSLENGAFPSDVSSVDPHDIILAPDNNNLIITCQKTNDVRVFDLTTHSVTAIVPTGIFPQDVVYAKSTAQYFISCTEDSTTFPGFHGVITCINATGFAVKNIKCGYQPHGIAVDEYKKLVYVLSRNISVSGPLPHHTSQCGGKNGFVNFIDLNTLAVLPNQYELSVDPYFIYARP